MVYLQLYFVMIAYHHGITDEISVGVSHNFLGVVDI